MVKDAEQRKREKEREGDRDGAKERERDREGALPDEFSPRVHDLRLQSRVESRRGASFRDPSPLGPRSISSAPSPGFRLIRRKSEAQVYGEIARGVRREVLFNLVLFAGDFVGFFMGTSRPEYLAAFLRMLRPRCTAAR